MEQHTYSRAYRTARQNPNDEKVLKECFKELYDDELLKLRADFRDAGETAGFYTCDRENVRRELIYSSHSDGDFTIIDSDGEKLGDFDNPDEAFESFEKHRVIHAYTDEKEAVTAAKEANEPVILFQNSGKTLTEDEIIGIIGDFKYLYPGIKFEICDKQIQQQTEEQAQADIKRSFSEEWQELQMQSVFGKEYDTMFPSDEEPEQSQAEEQEQHRSCHR